MSPCLAMKKISSIIRIIKKEVDKYFEIVDYTQKFGVLGGEALLHQDLPELLKYKRQFGWLRINTNGRVEPSDKLIEVLKEHENRKMC